MTQASVGSTGSRRGPVGQVVVLIPTFNERENLPQIVARMRTAVPEADVLVLDDNSPDGTGAVADDLARDDRQVRVLHRPGKEGLGAAYLAGFEWALAHGYDVLVELDADGSHPPDRLPAMLDGLRRGDRIVTGGGFLGTVSKVVGPDEVEVDLAPNVRVRVLRSTITSVLAKPDPAAAREAAKERDAKETKEKEPVRRAADKVQ